MAHQYTYNDWTTIEKALNEYYERHFGRDSVLLKWVAEDKYESAIDYPCKIYY